MMRTGRLLETVAVSLTLLLAGCGRDDATPLGPEPGGPCITPTQVCGGRIDVTSGVMLPVFRTHDLDAGDAAVTGAVIVVHGTNRDADNYFESMVVATAEAHAGESTVVVAPHFQTREDGPAPDEAYWSSSGWKRGNLSSSEGPSPRVSSYQALDRIVEILADASRFPALRRIVMTGHSAGGQVAHRYAATNRVEQTLAGVSIRYVVANPSTYLYLGPERWNGSAFSVPDREACPDYNEWHYGLEDLNSYARAVGPDSIRAQLVRRDVVILVGDADTGSSNLDQSCGANLEGPYRFLRGLTLVEYMDALFPGHRHRLAVVPGVGHSSRDMYTSEVGKGVLFNP